MHARTHTSLPVSLLKRGLTAMGLLGCVGAVATGCLSRPVQPGEPSTKTNYTATVKAAGIDKIDILFAIDNSASMGDKQDAIEGKSIVSERS